MKKRFKEIKVSFIINKKQKMMTNKDNNKTKNENKTESIGEQKIELAEEISPDILDELKKIPKGKEGLIVIKGPNIGEKFFLTKSKFNIGRSSDSDILLDDITVSRR